MSEVVTGLCLIRNLAGYISPSYAVLFGVIPVGVTYSSMKLKTRLSNLDDSLDVFYCHGIGGRDRVSVLVADLFARRGGVVLNGVICLAGRESERSEWCVLRKSTIAGNTGTPLYPLPPESTFVYTNPQILAIVVTIGVAVVLTGLILFFLKYTLGVALDKEVMAKGLDAYVVRYLAHF